MACLPVKRNEQIVEDIPLKNSFKNEQKEYRKIVLHPLRPVFATAQKQQYARASNSSKSSQRR